MKAPVFLDDLRLDRTSEVSLAEQLLHKLRSAILDGSVHAGSKMPSSRFLAQTLSVSRNIVISAYDHLTVEGYLEAKHGVGTFVARQEISEAPSVRSQPTLAGSHRAKDLILSAPGWLPTDATRVLSPGIPALDYFPRHRWNRCFTTAFSRLGQDALNYADPQGAPELREMIAGHIGPSRGVTCSPDQVIILSSFRQAMHVLFHFFLDEEDSILIENPCLPEIYSVANMQKLRVVPLPVEAEGADIKKISAQDSLAKLAVVSINHQYPLGVKMSAQKIAALLNWAQETGSFIIEDDYDGEFWMSSCPTQSLFARAKTERIIYVNSFSKTLFPALRVSYIVVPTELVEPMVQLKSLYDPYPSSMAQLTLAEFIGSGAYSAHLRDMRTLYKERFNILRNSLVQFLGNSLHISSIESGLHIYADLAPQFVDSEVANRMKGEGFGLNPVSPYYFSPPQKQANGIVMGFAGWDSKELTKAVVALGRNCF